MPQPAAKSSRNCRVVGGSIIDRYETPDTGCWISKNVSVTYTARHMSRTATDPNLLFDRLHRPLRQLFTMVEFHEQDHAFVFLIFRHLTDHEAVRYPLSVAKIRTGGWSGKASVKDIINLCGSEPDATRVPRSSKREGSTISTFPRRKRHWLLAENPRIDVRIGNNSQYPVAPPEHHKTSPVTHPRFR